MPIPGYFGKLTMGSVYRSGQVNGPISQNDDTWYRHKTSTRGGFALLHRNQDFQYWKYRGMIFLFGSRLFSLEPHTIYRIGPKILCVSGYPTMPSFSLPTLTFYGFLEDSVGFSLSDILFPYYFHIKNLNKIKIILPTVPILKCHVT